MGKVMAPFSDEQVKNLNDYQEHMNVHSFTCCSYDGCERSEQPNGGALVATNEGWVCPCGKWKQDWAHDYMADGRYLVDLNCSICGSAFKGAAPLMCCSGKDCTCMGQPLFPIVCSEECYNKLPFKLNPTEELDQDQRFEVANKLYRHVNPSTKMCTPNVAYEMADKWYKEYRSSYSNLKFYEWCIENKEPKNEK